ncbi:restriction endonuclease subunit S [Bradyrhizobium sp. STM 3843]|uniref:restriction endonuclease subunit S n=1 Tax=Bradyrhizobium sp. STM 3843 TaxID=551947 RepID=UPI0002ECF7D5|nr:restriction endonuclease subunit S [Bradyrhizobium sp. STM 3843]
MRPEGWVSTKIGDLCHLVNGMAFKPSDWSKKGLPIIRIQNLNRPNATFNYFDGPVRERFLVRNGDLLFAWSGTPGTSFGAHTWNGPNAVLNQHIFNVRYNDRVVDKTFFRYAINQTLDEQIAKAHGGVGLRHVTKGKFEETEIALPPISEQRRIASKIDRLTAKSRRARDQLDHLPRLVEKYKQAILAAAFQGELSREWRVKQGSFNELRTGYLNDLIETPIRNGLSIRGSDEPPGVRSLKLSALRARITDMSDVRFLPIEEAQVRRFELQEGDVLVVRGNGTKSLVGRASIVPQVIQPTIFPDTAFRIRPALDRADPHWLALIWNAPQVRIQIEDAAKTTAGIWKVSQADLSGIELLIPAVEEQRVIVQLVQKAFTWVERIASETSSARKLVDYLDRAILAKAFRGELVPQDPNDEPAISLLERIKAERVVEK